MITIKDTKYKKVKGLISEWNEEFSEKMTNSKLLKLKAISKNDSKIGFIEYAEHEGKYRLDTMFLLKSYRRQGIGTEVIKKLMAENFMMIDFPFPAMINLLLKLDLLKPVQVTENLISYLPTELIPVYTYDNKVIALNMWKYRGEYLITVLNPENLYERNFAYVRKELNSRESMKKLNIELSVIPEGLINQQQFLLNLAFTAMNGTQNEFLDKTMDMYRELGII